MGALRRPNVGHSTVAFLLLLVVTQGSPIVGPEAEASQVVISHSGEALSDTEGILPLIAQAAQNTEGQLSTDAGGGDDVTSGVSVEDGHDGFTRTRDLVTALSGVFAQFSARRSDENKRIQLLGTSQSASSSTEKLESLKIKAGDSCAELYTNRSLLPPASIDESRTVSDDGSDKPNFESCCAESYAYFQESHNFNNGQHPFFCCLVDDNWKPEQIEGSVAERDLAECGLDCMRTCFYDTIVTESRTLACTPGEGMCQNKPRLASEAIMVLLGLFEISRFLIDRQKKQVDDAQKGVFNAAKNGLTSILPQVMPGLLLVFTQFTNLARATGYTMLLVTFLTTFFGFGASVGSSGEMSGNQAGYVTTRVLTLMFAMLAIYYTSINIAAQGGDTSSMGLGVGSVFLSLLFFMLLAPTAMKGAPTGRQLITLIVVLLVFSLIPLNVIGLFFGGKGLRVFVSILLFILTVGLYIAVTYGLLGMSPVRPCDAGEYLQGGVICSKCPMGQFQALADEDDEGHIKAECVPCEKESYVAPGKGSTDCIRESVNSNMCTMDESNSLFLPQWGSRKHRLFKTDTSGECYCDKGHSVMDSISGHPRWTFVDQHKKVKGWYGKCEPCQPGSYKAEYTDSGCTTCPIGTYQNEEGQTECRRCGGPIQPSSTNDCGVREGSVKIIRDEDDTKISVTETEKAAIVGSFKKFMDEAKIDSSSIEILGEDFGMKQIREYWFTYMQSLIDTQKISKESIDIDSLDTHLQSFVVQILPFASDGDKTKITLLRTAISKKLKTRDETALKDMVVVSDGKDEDNNHERNELSRSQALQFILRGTAPKADNVRDALKEAIILHKEEIDAKHLQIDVNKLKSAGSETPFTVRIKGGTDDVMNHALDVLNSQSRIFQRVLQNKVKACIKASESKRYQDEIGQATCKQCAPGEVVVNSDETGAAVGCKDFKCPRYAKKDNTTNMCYCNSYTDYDDEDSSCKLRECRDKQQVTSARKLDSQREDTNVLDRHMFDDNGRCICNPAAWKPRNSAAADLLISNGKKTVWEVDCVSKCEPGTYASFIAAEVIAAEVNFEPDMAKIQNSACRPCSVGKYQDTAGAEGGCKPCSEGQFQDEEGKIECKLCQAGTYSNSLESHSCRECASGTYQYYTGQSSCTSCTGTPDKTDKKCCSKTKDFKMPDWVGRGVQAGTNATAEENTFVGVMSRAFSADQNSEIELLLSDDSPLLEMIGPDNCPQLRISSTNNFLQSSNSSANSVVDNMKLSKEAARKLLQASQDGYFIQSSADQLDYHSRQLYLHLRDGQANDGQPKYFGPEDNEILKNLDADVDMGNLKDVFGKFRQYCREPKSLIVLRKVSFKLDSKEKFPSGYSKELKASYEALRQGKREMFVLVPGAVRLWLPRPFKGCCGSDEQEKIYDTWYLFTYLPSLLVALQYWFANGLLYDDNQQNAKLKADQDLCVQVLKQLQDLPGEKYFPGSLEDFQQVCAPGRRTDEADAQTTPSKSRYEAAVAALTSTCNIGLGMSKRACLGLPSNQTKQVNLEIVEHAACFWGTDCDGCPQAPKKGVLKSVFGASEKSPLKMCLKKLKTNCLGASLLDCDPCTRLTLRNACNSRSHVDESADYSKCYNGIDCSLCGNLGAAFRCARVSLKVLKQSISEPITWGKNLVKKINSGPSVVGGQ